MGTKDTFFCSPKYHIFNNNQTLKLKLTLFACEYFREEILHPEPSNADRVVLVFFFLP